VVSAGTMTEIHRRCFENPADGADLSSNAQLIEYAANGCQCAPGLSESKSAGIEDRWPSGSLMIGTIPGIMRYQEDHTNRE